MTDLSTRVTSALRRHPLRSGALALTLTLLAALAASGLFTDGGLQLGQVWGVATAAGWRTVWVVVFLAAAGAVVWVLNQATLKNLVLASAVVVAYLLLGGLVLLNASVAAALGLGSFAARAQAFAVVSVVLLAVVAGLGVEAIRADGAPQPTLTDVLSLRTSAGSTIILLWTAVVIYGLAVIGGFAILETLNNDPSAAFDCGLPAGSGLPITDRNCVVPGAAADYLILLGVPGAAAALTKIDGEGAAKDEDEATVDGPATTKAVADLQYLVFNAFSMVYVLASLVEFGRLPRVPDVLLALSGASALIYTLNRKTAPAGAGAPLKPG